MAATSFDYNSLATTSGAYQQRQVTTTDSTNNSTVWSQQRFNNVNVVGPDRGTLQRQSSIDAFNLVFGNISPRSGSPASVNVDWDPSALTLDNFDLNEILKSTCSGSPLRNGRQHIEVDEPNDGGECRAVYDMSPLNQAQPVFRVMSTTTNRGKLTIDEDRPRPMSDIPLDITAESELTATRPVIPDETPLPVSITSPLQMFATIAAYHQEKESNRVGANYSTATASRYAPSPDSEGYGANGVGGRYYLNDSSASCSPSMSDRSASATLAAEETISTSSMGRRRRRRRPVEKGTTEYLNSRERNNQAVKKSRMKAKQIYMETQRTLTDLQVENAELRRRLDIIERRAEAAERQRDYLTELLASVAPVKKGL